jgi:hypothetical protein
MSVVLLDRRRQRPLEGIPWEMTRRSRGANRPATGLDVPRSLDELVTSALEALVAHETVCCPACSGRMVSRRAISGGIRSGECLDCGAQLS